MKFHEALAKSIETGIGVYRTTWNGNIIGHPERRVAQWVAPYRPGEAGDAPPPWPVTTPFFYISQPMGSTPWVPSQGDLFAEDWETL